MQDGTQPDPLFGFTQTQPPFPYFEQHPLPLQQQNTQQGIPMGFSQLTPWATAHLSEHRCTAKLAPYVTCEGPNVTCKGLKGPRTSTIALVTRTTQWETVVLRRPRWSN